MASLLFQSGKTSSSSSSSSANPFQALAHFYEQELTDLHIDQQFDAAAVSKQTSTGHLFPSAFASSSHSAVPTATPHQDEFKTFSQNASVSVSQWDSHSHLHNSPLESDKSHTDLSEYLKQRQDYYAREARIRSQDRHDGLGPIIDFSEPYTHIHSDHYPCIFKDTSRRQEFSHYNTNAQSHRRQPTRPSVLKGSSQLEQVWMDLGSNSVPTKIHGDNSVNTIRVISMESAWSKYSGETTSSDIPNSITSHHSAAYSGYPRTSNYREAAAALHSSWPMAPWAIEAEAAFMEADIIHHQPITIDNDIKRRATADVHVIQTTMDMTNDSQWAEEFSLASSTMDDCKNDRSTAIVAESSIGEQQCGEREPVVKTCGFMLDAKNHRVVTDAGFMDADYAQLISMDNCTQSTDALVKLNEQHSIANVEHSLLHQVPAEVGEHRNRSILIAYENDTNTDLKERPRQVFNDDIFEGDMLQAWMETLANEKKEAEEQDQEKEQVMEDTMVRTKSDEEVAKDEFVLEIAIRRLNALMHQLGRTQKSIDDSTINASGTTEPTKAPIPNIQERASILQLYP
ncbi:hypothetical protein FBU30_005517 [Linnemannia zychae]|nr:hypothetical protein FBU30_005517 [Linnemannia zychae]